MANLNLPHKAARQQIASAITVVIQVLRLIDGRRKVTSIQEITGMEGEVITMQEIFGFKQTGLSPDGKVQGHFQASGVQAEIQRPAARVRRRAARRDVRPVTAVPVKEADHADFFHGQFVPGHGGAGLRRGAAAARKPLSDVAVAPGTGGHETASRACRRCRRRRDRTPQTQLLKQRMLSELPTVERYLQSLPRMRALDRVILQSGLNWTVSKLLLGCARRWARWRGWP